MCSCQPRCGNRASQAGVTLPLEVFHTGTAAGFGLRCRTALPAGTLLCVYAGDVVPARVGRAARAQARTQAQAPGERRDRDVRSDMDHPRASSPPRARSPARPLSAPPPAATQGMTYRLCVRESFGRRTLVTCVDAAACGNEARFCNHSCSPNVDIVPVRQGWVPRLLLVTARSVPAREELCFDYAAGSGATGTDGTPGTPPPLSHTPCCCGSAACRGFLPAVAE